MVVAFGKIKDVNQVKKKLDQVVRCPKCEKKIKIGIELEVVNKSSALKNIYFPHIYIHGKPLHALICYLNAELKVRNIGIIESIEISRDFETFNQLLNKWMNPY